MKSGYLRQLFGTAHRFRVRQKASDDVPCQTPPGDASCAGGSGDSETRGTRGCPGLAACRHRNRRSRKESPTMARTFVTFATSRQQCCSRSRSPGWCRHDT